MLNAIATFDITHRPDTSFDKRELAWFHKGVHRTDCLAYT